MPELMNDEKKALDEKKAVEAEAAAEKKEPPNVFHVNTMAIADNMAVLCKEHRTPEEIIGARKSTEQALKNIHDAAVPVPVYHPVVMSALGKAKGLIRTYLSIKDPKTQDVLDEIAHAEALLGQ